MLKKIHVWKEQFLNLLDRLLMKAKLRKPPTQQELGGVIYVHATHKDKDGRLVSVPLQGRELKQFVKATLPVRQAMESKLADELAKPSLI